MLNRARRFAETVEEVAAAATDERDRERGEGRWRLAVRGNADAMHLLAVAACQYEPRHREFERKWGVVRRAVIVALVLLIGLVLGACECRNEPTPATHAGDAGAAIATDAGVTDAAPLDVDADLGQHRRGACKVACAPSSGPQLCAGASPAACWSQCVAQHADGAWCP